MRNLITLLSLFLFSASTVWSQDYNLHLYDDSKAQDKRIMRNWNWFAWDLQENLPDGNYVVYHDSTHREIYLTGRFEGGKKNGTWTFYHVNGIVERTVPYLFGMVHGLVTEYSYSGDTITKYEFNYNTCYKTTRWDNYYHLKGAGKYPKSIGVLVAPQISAGTDFNPDGTVQSVDTSNYITGIRHAVHYYDDGTPSWEYFEDLNGNRANWSINHPRSNPADAEGLSFDLSKPEHWKRFDSLAFFPNVTTVVIRWRPTEKLTRKQTQQLNRKIALLRSLKKLETLNLQVSGNVPSNIYTLTGLKALNVMASEGMSPKIGKLKNLVSLEWWYLFFEKPQDTAPDLHLPKSLEKLRSLESLTLQTYVMKNPDQEFRSLRNLPELETLSTYYCGIKTFPLSIAALKSLRVLYLTGGDNHGVVGTEIRMLPDTFFTMHNLRFACLPVTLPDSVRKTYVHRLPLCMLAIESLCFTGETQITMGDGSAKAIQEIKEGDVVLAFDFEKQRTDTATVTHLLSHAVGETMILKIQYGPDARLNITPNHPVYCGNGEFQPAGLLNGYSTLYQLNETRSVQESQYFSVSPALFSHGTLYNFGTTKGNYFANGVLVHNK